MLQNNIPDPYSNYTTKLHISQVFRGVYRCSIVTFVCYVFGGNVVECYVRKF